MEQSTSSLTETAVHIRDSSTLILGHMEVQGDAQNTFSVILERLSVLDKIEARLEKIENSVEKLDQMELNLKKVTTAVGNLEVEVNSLQLTFADHQTNLEGLSRLFDDLGTKVETVSETGKELKTRIKKLESNMAETASTSKSLEDHILDLRSRSMQNNLLFFGIREQQGENCEQLVRGFIREKLGLEFEPEFERIHRLGQYRGQADRPRVIVARFSRYKDREAVRRQAPRKLQGSSYGVHEQFPREIEMIRKSLYPVMREAKRRGDRVRLVGKDLYINGTAYKPKNVTGSVAGTTVQKRPIDVRSPPSERPEATDDLGSQQNPCFQDPKRSRPDTSTGETEP